MSNKNRNYAVKGWALGPAVLAGLLVMSAAEYRHGGLSGGQGFLLGILVVFTLLSVPVVSTNLRKARTGKGGYSGEGEQMARSKKTKEFDRFTYEEEGRVAVVPGHERLLFLAVGVFTALAAVLVVYLIDKYTVFEIFTALKFIIDEYGRLITWIIVSVAGLYAIRVYAQLKHIELITRRVQLEEMRQRVRNNEIAMSDAEALAEQIAERVISNTAARGGALASLHAGPRLTYWSTESVFGQRNSHFAAEKKSLAKAVLKLLDARIHALKEQRRVVIIVDSGTTLFPLFEYFGRWIVRQWSESIFDDPDKKNSVRDRVSIVTNSIPGIESLNRFGRLQPEDPYSELACNAQIIGGRPLAVYQASVGKLAETQLGEVRSPIDDKEKGEPYVIGLTTGNYIFVVDGVPTPIARGKGHGRFKAKLMDVSDEVYVIGPLGKFIVEDENTERSLDEFNTALNYERNARTVHRRCYAKVPISDSSKLHAITTYRPNPNDFFHGHSQRVEARLRQQNVLVLKKELEELDDADVRKQWAAADAKTIGHLMIQFQHIGSSLEEQRILEMPHSNIRHPSVSEQFFGIR